MTIIITGGFTATLETVEALKAAALAHVTRSRAEDGCISHHLHVDAENPFRLFFFERWRDAAAVRAHFTVPASAEFVKDLRERAETIEELAIYNGSTVKLG